MNTMNKMWVGIALVLLSTMLLPGVRAELVIEKPSPSAGDFWIFSYKSGPLTGTETFTMTGTQTVTVNGTSYNAYAISMAGSGTFNDGTYSGTFSMAGTYHMTTQDFARVKSYFQETLIVTSGTTSTVVTYCNFTNQPPAKDYDFPMKAGKTWSYSTTEDSVCQSIVNGVPQGPSHNVDKQSLQVNVLSATTTTVPAGTFETLYIKDNQSTPSESWFSADIGFIVKEQDGSGYKLELTSYKYTKPSPAGAILGDSSMMIIIAIVVVIVVVVVVVVVVLMMKKKKAAASATMLPPQPGAAPVATTQTYAQPAPVPISSSPPPAAYSPPPPAIPTPAYSQPPPATYPLPAQQAPPPAAPASAQPAPTALCPTCRSPLRIIPEYNKWYCDACRKYP